jgi:hypothetical protein
VVGPVVASLATVAIWRVADGLRWVVGTAGAWLVLAVVLVPHPPGALVNGVAVGIALAASSLVRGHTGRGLGGGWAAVIDPTAVDDPIDPGPGR